MWIVAEPRRIEEARAVLKDAVQCVSAINTWRICDYKWFRPATTFSKVVISTARRVETIATMQKATMIREEGRTARLPGSSRTNADDCLPPASLGRV